MTATHPAPTRRLDPSARGLIVLVVAVVLGLVLLARAEPGRVGTARVTANRLNTATTVVTVPPATSPLSVPNPTTSTPPASTPSTVAAGAHPAAQVKVIVLNGSGGTRAGVARSNTAKVQAKGYDTLPAGSANAQPNTVVYYASGYQTDALAVAQALGTSQLRVEPLPSPPPSPSASQANVTVLLGQDTPAP